VFALRASNEHQPLRLPGQVAEQFDLGANGATGKSYNVYRWYRPTWGRCTQSDPIGLEGGANPYAYAYDRPVVIVDRNGHFVTIVVGGLVGAAVGGVGAYLAGGNSQQIWAGIGGGFVAGAVAGTGVGLIGEAVAGGTLSLGGALGAGAVFGTASGVLGNTTQQLVQGSLCGKSPMANISQINTRSQLISGAFGAGTGLASGGLAAISAQGAIANAWLSQNLSEGIRTLPTQNIGPLVTNTLNAYGSVQVNVGATSGFNALGLPFGQEFGNRSVDPSGGANQCVCN
jgi:RHS repeat-associated protein